MADYTIKANLQVTDDGATAQKRTQEAQRLNQELDKLETSNKRRTAAAAKAENTDYNAARAIGGGTGAAGRDFGKEARSIGGLVAIYAQYAATIFAVEAAFRKLKEAADFENMTKGMEQMSARSGVSLGAMSKQFQAATGFAVSMKDSMEAVSKASGAGLSQEQILKIADIAKKASVALGRDLNDSVSRLSRGISKLEPELLDELGIYTKLGPAVEKYAAALGKPVHALTELERAQGFAIAVLKEGGDKYNTIKVDSNPYDKLLASITNLSLQGLTLINSVLKPLVGFLSENPTALTGVMILLAKSIFDKFLPAISQLRQSARAEADALAVAAAAKLDYAKKANAVQNDLRRQAFQAEVENIEQLKAAQVGAADSALKVAKKGMSDRAKTITDPNRDISKISKAELAYIDELGAKQTKVAQQYRDWSAAVKDYQKNNRDEAEKTAQLDKKLNATAGVFSPQAAINRDAEKARQKAAAGNIVATAGETAGILGFKASWNEMTANISRADLSIPRALLTGISGTAAAAATRLMQFVGALGNVGMAISILAGTKAILDMFLSTAVKETEALASKTEILAEVTKTAVDVFKNYGDETTVAGLSAKSKAIDGIAQSLKELPKQLEEQQKAQGAWSKFWENVLPTALGGQTRSNAIEGFGKSVIAAINDAATPELKSKAEEKLKDLLEIKGPLTQDKVTAKLENASRATMESVTGLVEDINKANKKIAAPGEDVADKYKKLEKAFTDLNNTFISNDAGTKYALALIAQMNSLATAVDDPIAKLAQLRDLANNTSKLDLLPANIQTEFRAATAEMQKLETQLRQAKDEQAAAEKLIQQGKQKAIDIAFNGGNTANYASSASIIADGQRQLNAALDKQKDILAKEKDLSDKTIIKMSGSMETAIKFIEGPLVRAIQSASINYQKALVSTLPRTEATVAMTAKLELESIAIRKSEITALYELSKETRLSRLNTERINLEAKLAEETGGGAFKLTGEDRVAAEKRLKQIPAEIEATTSNKTAKEFDKEGNLTDTIANIISERIGVKVKLAQLGGEAGAIEVKRVTDTIAARFDKIKQEEDQKLQKLQAENKQYLGGEEFRKLPTQEARDVEIARRTALEVAQQNKIAQLPFEQNKAQGSAVLDLSRQKGFSGVAALGAEAMVNADKNLQQMRETQGIIEKTVDAETKRKALLDQTALTNDRLNASTENNKNLDVLSLDAQLRNNDAKLKGLQIDKDNGKISEFTFSVESNALALTNADIERRKAKVVENAKYEADTRNLILEQKKNNIYETEEAKIARKRQDDNHSAALQGIDDEYYAKKKLIDLELEAQNEKSKREQAYSQVIEKGIDTAADKFTEFVTTGKTSFKGLIDSMIADLIRYELKQQMLKLYNGPDGLGGGPGIMSAVKSGASDLFSWGKSLFASAQGSAWDQGVMKYAMGGIVTQPTLFKFAQGTGMMGEAGPEAIMPLRRDGAGNLGVINGGGGNVDVVVNNYGNDKATTTETKDSKGNRKIEVIIGDMVADQLSTTGSSSQKALNLNYGNRPALVRR
jgi:lambda family phage tail tape measure protein